MARDRIDQRFSKKQDKDRLAEFAKRGLTPEEIEDRKHVYHIYAICIQNRDALIKALATRDIFCGIHYPLPVHLQEVYQFLDFHDGSFPVAELCASRFVSLPMYPDLSKKQIEYVVDEIKRFMSEKI